MREMRIDGEIVALDEDGHLSDPEQWCTGVAERLAEKDGIRLTDEHWWLIEFVRDYHHQYGTPPLMRVMVAEFRRRHGGQGSSRDLYRLFPESPVRQACKYGGLPKPEWCI
ncbi:MAG: TusE/DsrC/DsvC family sulfur relay protein [Wenzhouxiangella sp.]